MTYASPLHVRIPPRRNPRNNWPVLKALAFALAAVAVVLVAIVAAVMGSGRLMPVSLETRTDLRYTGTFGPPQRRLAWSTLSNEVMQSPFYLAEAQTDADAAPVVALAALPEAEKDDRFADRFVTGSLGPKVVTPEQFLRPAANARLDADRPLVRANDKASGVSRPCRPPKSASAAGARTKPRPGQPITTSPRDRLRAGWRAAGSTFPGSAASWTIVSTSAFRMRGTTPPDTYRLNMREALFHVVRAIHLCRRTGHDAWPRRRPSRPHARPNRRSNGCIWLKNSMNFLPSCAGGVGAHGGGRNGRSVFARGNTQQRQNLSQYALEIVSPYLVRVVPEGRVVPGR